MYGDTAVDRFKHKVGDAAWQRLQNRLTELSHDIRTRGIRPFNGVDLLTGYSYGEFYDWDLYFENIYLSYYGISRYCRTNLRVFLDQQLECGFVPRTLVSPRWRQHFKPFLAQIALLGCRQTGDYRWLQWKTYRRLRNYLDYWFWHCDFDKNGLCVWDSADHSGMDNQVSRAGELNSMTVEGVDLNCYLVRELQAMAVLAGALGRTDDTAEFDAHAAWLIESINKTFWNEADGFYYDRNERTGQQIRVKSVAGFVPLWLGIVAGDRAHRLVNEHLLNEEEFWLPYPVATYAKTEPDYYQERQGGECNWRGTAWIPTNYMVFHGLLRQGFTDAAETLAYRTFEMVLAEETTREYYNAETGTGQGLDRFWGWSSLGYFMPLEFELRYDPTDVANESIEPIANLMGVSFPRV